MQIVNKLTHVFVLFIDHIYIKETLIEEFPNNATVENIYFLDHDTVRIVIEKNLLICIPLYKSQKCVNEECDSFLCFLVAFVPSDGYTKG